MIGLGYEPKGFSIVKTYDDEYDGDSELGDLFIVPGKGGSHHAGVGCSEVEIIHFTSKAPPPEPGGKAQHCVAHWRRLHLQLDT